MGGETYCAANHPPTTTSRHGLPRETDPVSQINIRTIIKMCMRRCVNVRGQKRLYTFLHNNHTTIDP